MRFRLMAKAGPLVCIAFLGLASRGLNAQTATLDATQSQPVVAAAESTEANRAENLPAGINDSFLDPEMKVEDFIKRFEIESREVFACRQQILAAVQLKPGMSIADVGAGTGLYLGAFSQVVGKQGKVFAIDIAPNFVKHLRARAKQEQLDNAQVVLCSDHDVNLPPNCVDRVFVCDVYHHFEYPASSLASIYAALRPGGQLILVDFHNEAEGERGEWLKNHVRAPKQVFKQEVIDAGFTFAEEVDIDGFKENYFLRFMK